MRASSRVIAIPGVPSLPFATPFIGASAYAPWPDKSNCLPPHIQLLSTFTCSKFTSIHSVCGGKSVQAEIQEIVSAHTPSHKWAYSTGKTCGCVQYARASHVTTPKKSSGQTWRGLLGEHVMPSIFQDILAHVRTIAVHTCHAITLSCILVHTDEILAAIIDTSSRVMSMREQE